MNHEMNISLKTGRLVKKIRAVSEGLNMMASMLEEADYCCENCGELMIIDPNNKDVLKGTPISNTHAFYSCPHCNGEGDFKKIRKLKQNHIAEKGENKNA